MNTTKIGALGRKCLFASAALIASGLNTFASDLTIHLAGAATFTRKTVQYECDGSGTKIGVPSGSFPVEYINGGGNSLVIVPVGGNSLVFANVSSGSGARYVSQQYTWWDAQGKATLYSDSLGGKSQSTCTPVNK